MGPGWLGLALGMTIGLCGLGWQLGLHPTSASGYQRGYDLVVYGATPQGVAAAVAAARQGLHVVVVEPGPWVGGVLTNAWLATWDLAWDAGGETLHGGLFLEIYHRLGGEASFDVHRAERELRRMLEEAGVELRLERRVRGVRMERRAGDGGLLLLGLDLRGPGGEESLSAPYYIDATDTAELAARAGAPFTIGRQDAGSDAAQMAATLIFRLTGVPWSSVQAAAHREGRRMRTGAGARGRSAWGFGNLAEGYQPGDPERFALRGLNLALQDDGSILVNALLIFGVDGTNPAAVRKAHEEARREAERVVEYLRRAAPDLFGGARLAGVAPALYIRESRHLVGLYRLRADDVLYGRSFEDGVAVGGYPLDGQAYLPGEIPYLLGVPAPYSVPFRTLVPVGIANLLVVSQAASFESTAAFSARVVPLQIALGEAAGVATVLAGEMGLDYPALASNFVAMESLRSRLRTLGARVDGEPGPVEANDPAYEPAVRLLRKGLFNTPYQLRGGLHLDVPINIGDFLADLLHYYRPRDPEVTRVLQGLYAYFRPRRREPLKWWEAGWILESIGYPVSYADGERPVLRRDAVWLLSRIVEPGS